MTTMCPECLGDGYIQCPNCDGEGVVDEAPLQEEQLPGIDWSQYEHHRH